MSQKSLSVRNGVCGSMLAFWILVANMAVSQKQPSANSLFSNFQNPGNAARPRVWWHWMQGNITQEGIRNDLLWMHRSGIGGVHNFDAGLATPQVVAQRLNYMSPAWQRAFRLAVHLTDSLGMEMAIAGSPGWSQSGGPWVPAADGMKKVVWRELDIHGGQPFRAALPNPYTTTGPFQNIPEPEETTAFTSKAAPPAAYYRDIAVIACRLSAADVSLANRNPVVSSSGGQFTLAQLTDGDLTTGSLLPVDSTTGYGWVQIAFTQPQTVKAITLAGGASREPWGSEPPDSTRRLDVSDDGVTFRPIAWLPLGGVEQQTIALPPTTARFFRVVIPNPVLSKYVVLAFPFTGPVPTPTSTPIAELVLHPTTRINHVEEKAGFAATFDLSRFPTPASPDVLAETDVLDITQLLQADGTLNWTPPAGNWKVFRFGYSLTGKKNHPASPEATGLEVDKMDARAVRDYFTNYLNPYKTATEGLMGSRGLQYLITDSYEAGQETWTPRMADEFQKRRGYNLLRWLPVLTGQIIASSEASEQFLWDWRKTIGELIAENHYDQLTSILADYGMKRYSESHENGRQYVVDGMDVKRTAAVPMSAMWVPSGWGSTVTMAQADIRESASVAHLYGQNLVAAESMTAFGFGNHAWSYSPETLKPTADLELANGLNRFVIHTSVHQPVDDKIPGLGLFVFGQWFNRHETWAGQAKAWTDYLARSSYLLQQGKFVADIVYYYGEDNNVTGLFGHQLPDVPEGYNYDFINPHALLTLLSVKDGKLVTPSGMQYRVLVLDSNARRMSLPVLRKIAQLVKAGATISGVKPEHMAGLTDNREEFDRLIHEVWDSGNPQVLTNKTIQQVLSEVQILPDFHYAKTHDSTEVLYVHRRLTNSDLYWVNNRKARPETLTATFRVGGKVPQIWHPETGQSEPVSYTITGGQTTIILNLAPNDALFVVFQTPTSTSVVTLPKRIETDVLTLSGPWQVAFQPNRGSPAQVSLAQLGSYTENPDLGIKYFSGTATYTKSFNVPGTTLRPSRQVWLDLGDVRNLAEVIINGKSLGVVWKQPYRVAVTNALKSGENTLAIRVVNLWVNRIIGDMQPQTTQKFTYTTVPFYKADSPLQPSGLLGPVKIVATP